MSDGAIYKTMEKIKNTNFMNRRDLSNPRYCPSAVYRLVSNIERFEIALLYRATYEIGRYDKTKGKYEKGDMFLIEFFIIYKDNDGIFYTRDSGFVGENETSQFGTGIINLEKDLDIYSKIDKTKFDNEKFLNLFKEAESVKVELSVDEIYEYSVSTDTYSIFDLFDILRQFTRSPKKSARNC